MERHTLPRPGNRGRIEAPPLILGALAFWIPAFLEAQFSPPRLVSDAASNAQQLAMGIDAANNVYLSSVVDEQIRVKVIGPGVDADAPIPAEASAQGDPDFATNIAGTTYLVFSQVEAASPEEGREIYLTANVGGQFSAPRPLTENRVDDHAPRLALDVDGEPHVAWVQQVGETARVFYAVAREGQSVSAGPVAEGDYPQLFVDEEGVAHVVYSRRNDLLYNSNRGGAWQNERSVTTTPFDPESSPGLGGDRAGNLVVAFESRNSLYVALKPAAGDFRAARLLDTGGILDPRLRVRERGQVALVYAKRGDVFFIQGQPAALDLPRQITSTPDVESLPSLEVDGLGSLHVGFLRDGNAYYTSNAAAPVAELAADPVRGEAPLEVQFSDLSSGGIQVWEWDFGDGSTSTEQNPTHQYLQPGKYTVKLRVVAPGAREASVTKEDLIFVQDPFNTLRIQDQVVVPGQQEVWFPVLASHREPIAAFQLLGTYDPNFLRLLRFDQTFSAIFPLEPEFFEAHDRGTYFEVGCAFEFEPPIEPEQQYLGPGTNQTILNLVFDVTEDAPQGATTQVELLNNRALSPIANIFTINRFTRLPVLQGANVEILLGPPFPGFFVRGDADGNREVDITDAIRILSYLFSGGQRPVCLDAADVNDTGDVDISGAISILGYLFLGGAAPAVPFPLPGADPSRGDPWEC